MRIILALLLACLSASAQLVINNQVACVAVGISGQPSSLVNLTNVGQTLTVTATGAVPYAYQWHLGTSATNALAGATTSSYSYTNQTAATNSYCAVVTNACGSITSSVATLAWTNGTGGGTWTPTNFLSYTCDAWWAVEFDTATDNAHVNTIKDGQVNNLHYTNTLSSGYQPVFHVGGGPNGSNYVRFDGTNHFLKSSVTVTQPFEVVTVLRYWGFANNGSYNYIYSSDSNLRVWIPANGVHRAQASSPNYIDGGQFITNKWMVIDHVFNGSSCYAYTNNVLDMSGNAGTAGMTNLYLACDNGLGHATPIDVVEQIVFHGASVPGQNSTDRATMFSALTNKYGISP